MIKDEKSVEVYTVPVENDIEDNGIKQTAKKWWHIDKQMLSFKFHYFFYVAGLGATCPYIAIYGRDVLGISATGTGALLTVQQFIFVFSKVLIGYLADYFNKLKIIIVVLITVNAFSFAFLLVIPIDSKSTQSQSDSQLYEFPLNLYGKECVGCESSDPVITPSNRQESSKSILLLNCSKPFQLLNPGQSCSSSNFSGHADMESTYHKAFCDFCTGGQTVYETFSLKVLRLNKSLQNVPPIALEANTTNGCLQEVKHLIHYTLDMLNNINDNIVVNACYDICENDEKFHFENSTSSVKQTKSVLNIIRKHTCQCLVEPHSLLYKKILCTNTSKENKRVDIYSFYSALHAITYCQMESDLHAKNSISISLKSDFAKYQYWVFAIMYTIGAIAINAVFSLSDTACCESILKSGAQFGRQRLWGGVGWGITAPLCGLLNDWTGSYLAQWITMGVCMVLTLINMSRLDLVKPQFSQNIMKDVGTVMKSKEFLSFQLCCFFNGIGTGIVWFYGVWFLSSIGASSMLCGLALTAQSFIGVIPLMFLSGYIIEKIGHFSVVSLALLAHTIRFVWYSYLQNPWLCLPVEWLHGVSYGLLYTAIAAFSKMSAKPGTEATTLAVLFSTHEGLGAGIGCVVGGLGFDNFGLHKTYSYIGVFTACCLLVSIILNLLVRRKLKVMPVSVEDS